MNRAAVALACLAAVAAAAFGTWWFLVRDTSIPGEGACEPPVPEALVPEIRQVLPHDPDAYTQGLLLSDGQLWESTGRRGESELRRIDPVTGEVLASAALAPELFGEGLAVGDDGELVQLTWTSGTALRWDREGPAEIGSFSYDGEGWGLATLDGGDLVMSNGSDTLSIRSPSDFSIGSLLSVQRRGGDAGELNELEWDGTHLWANRYQTDEILRIDLDCGTVDGVVDASSLTAAAQATIDEAGLDRDLVNADVLNGIAWLGPAEPDHFYVTGKRWPVTFDVTMVPAA